MAYLASYLTESLVYMARKHVHVIAKRSLQSQNVFTTFYCFGVYHIAENFPFLLQLVEVIWTTAGSPGKTFTQYCAEKYEGFLHFTA